MSYLRFRNIKWAYRTDVAYTIFSWPVKVLPIQFWELGSNTLDLLEESILSLIGTGEKDPVSLKQLLGIDDGMERMIMRTIQQLQIYHYLDQSLNLTEEGRKALLHHDAVQRSFKKGYLLFDQVRGCLFPYVHIGPLKYHQREKISLFELFTLPTLNAELSVELVHREGQLVIAKHNQRRIQYEWMESEDLEGLDDFFALEQSSMGTLADSMISEFRLLESEFQEEHHLLLEVTAEMASYTLRPVFISYSPFAMVEQDQYFATIMGLSNPEIERAISDLQERCIELTRAEEPNSTSDDELITAIEQRLGGGNTKLPNTLLDELCICEKRHQQAFWDEQWTLITVEEPFLKWGRYLELVLELVFQEVNASPVANKWLTISTKNKNNPEVWASYKAAVTNTMRSDLWLDVPILLEQVIRQKIVNLSKTGQFGSDRMSSRDYLAELVLAALSKQQALLSGRLGAFSSAIEQCNGLICRLDQIVDCRNAGSHADGKLHYSGDKGIAELARTDYESLLNDVRDTIYTLLRHLFVG